MTNIAVLNELHSYNNGSLAELGPIGADNLYVKVLDKDGTIEGENGGDPTYTYEYVPLSVIMQNYVDFASNYKGLAITYNKTPTNDNVLIWVHDDSTSWDVVDLADTSVLEENDSTLNSDGEDNGGTSNPGGGDDEDVPDPDPLDAGLGD